MRLNQHHRWLMACVSLLLCATSFAAAPGIIKGKVSDAGGSPIANAYVILHADLAGRTNQAAVLDQVRQTDQAGLFKIQLEPGFYDVCVTAMAFSPVCKKVLVTGSKVTEHDVNLTVDPLVSEHLADRF